MADLLNYRKEDSDPNWRLDAQKLGDDRVLTVERAVPALVDGGGRESYIYNE